MYTVVFLMFFPLLFYAADYVVLNINFLVDNIKPVVFVFFSFFVPGTVSQATKIIAQSSLLPWTTRFYHIVIFYSKLNIEVWFNLNKFHIFLVRVRTRATKRGQNKQQNGKFSTTTFCEFAYVRILGLFVRKITMLWLFLFSIEIPPGLCIRLLTTVFEPLIAIFAKLTVASKIFFTTPSTHSRLFVLFHVYSFECCRFDLLV